jgi:hypothetical protein
VGFPLQAPPLRRDERLRVHDREFLLEKTRAEAEEGCPPPSVREFDEEERTLLDPEDLERGHSRAKNRLGITEAVPIVTLSLAVIERRKLPGEVHPALLSHVAASLKATAKRKAAEERRSAFVFERRTHVEGPAQTGP